MARKAQPKVRPQKNETRYADFDEESACWGVFGQESGFCYELYSSEEEAQEHV